MGLNTVCLNSINLGYGNFDEDDSETVIYVRLMASHNKCKQRKACQKEISKEKSTCCMASKKLVGLVHPRK